MQYIKTIEIGDDMKFDSKSINKYITIFTNTANY